MEKKKQMLIHKDPKKTSEKESVVLLEPTPQSTILNVID